MPRKYILPCAQCGVEFSADKPTTRYCCRACWRQSLHRPLTERLWEKIDQSGGPEACWPWTAAHNHLGYGIVRVDGKNVGAHRIAYELTFGPIPEELVICHICDNGACCNPYHLWAGTMQENTEDMVSKGRARGAQRKLSTEQVRELRRRHASGERQYRLAAEFGISRGHLNSIIHRKERVLE
jgi:hypothetical protein